jgi:ribonuclease BN (tRNA processing enzyme)
MQACLLVEADGRRFLVDCGASAMIAMRRYGVNPSEIGLILLSHLHGDHFAGVPFVILDGQLVSRRTEPLTIVGPPGTEQRVKQAMENMFPGSADAERRFRVEIVEFDLDSESRFDDVVVRPFEVRHVCGGPALALRIECGGKVLAYSGDTEWTEALLDVASGADLFVVEAYFFDKRVKYHLDYATLSANRDRLGARRTVVTHMSAEMLGRLDELDCEYAEDGKVIEIG